MCRTEPRLLGLLVACLWLAGCSDIYYDRRDSISPSLGDALAVDKITEMVDPWPAASRNRNIAFNGQRAAAAMERYRTNKVTPPANATTSSTPYQQTQPVVAGTPSSQQ